MSLMFWADTTCRGNETELETEEYFSLSNPLLCAATPSVLSVPSGLLLKSDPGAGAGKKASNVCASLLGDR